MNEFLMHIEWWISTWHAISVPNDNATRRRDRFADMINSMESLRGSLRFEEEPASFEAALIRDPGNAQ
ncbi:hypothetical protein X773_21765 [Mesorhizobium sp. LSJC285A00]|uniref:hypothetical protein n=2 Tax=unclassified Mesorhizobium TaxID=325217 RepID=UPI0003CF3870|nr:hypothetical protein [Mesorhizobium sp. LSJC285A00]ESW78013.1 hypothetical protein X773_21765 [Mesorhizobium sp. LSJC285A00]